MSSLYQITQDLVALEQLIEQVGGDITEGTQGEALEKWMKEYEWQQRDKVDGYCSLITNMESDVDAIGAEVKRLNDRARVIVNRIERLKAMAKLCMETLGVRRLEGQKFSMAIQKNGGKDPLELIVENADYYPDRFVKVRREVDKDALRIALEKADAEAARLARLGERGETVRIR